MRSSSNLLSFNSRQSHKAFLHLPKPDEHRTHRNSVWLTVRAPVGGDVEGNVEGVTVATPASCRLNFYLVARGQERIEPRYQFGATAEQIRYPCYHSRRVDTAGDFVSGLLREIPKKCTMFLSY